MSHEIVVDDGRGHVAAPQRRDKELHAVNHSDGTDNSRLVTIIINHFIIFTRLHRERTERTERTQTRLERKRNESDNHDFVEFRHGQAQQTRTRVIPYVVFPLLRVTTQLN